jgi:ATP-dependent Lhr-like helicase
LPAGASTVNRHLSLGPNSALSTQHSALSTEKVARQLLRRYGVVFRDLLARETLVQSWRDLLVAYRRMELQGEIRGGRFVSGFVGEQFALPEAVEALRAMRKGGVSASGLDVKLSACDPLNLAGIILPGPRIPAVPTNFLVLKDGVVVRTVFGKRDDGRPREAARVVRGSDR